MLKIWRTLYGSSATMKRKRSVSISNAAAMRRMVSRFTSSTLPRNCSGMANDLNLRPKRNSSSTPVHKPSSAQAPSIVLASSPLKSVSTQATAAATSAYFRSLRSLYRVIGVNAAAKVLLDRPAGVTFVFVWYEGIFRWLSHFWPIRIARAESAMGTVEIRWENGHKVLNSSNGNQSFGSLHEVWVQSF